MRIEGIEAVAHCVIEIEQNSAFTPCTEPRISRMFRVRLAAVQSYLRASVQDLRRDEPLAVFQPLLFPFVLSEFFFGQVDRDAQHGLAFHSLIGSERKTHAPSNVVCNP